MEQLIDTHVTNLISFETKGFTIEECDNAALKITSQAFGEIQHFQLIARGADAEFTNAMGAVIVWRARYDAIRG